MTDSAHARFRTRLEALNDYSTFAPVLAGDHTWERRYARFDPSSEPFVVTAFQSDLAPHRLLRVDVFQSRHPGAVETTAGWLRATPFERDEGLPTLRSVLAQHDSWIVARYLPSRRCTLRFDSRYVKVYRDQRGERAHEAGQLLWASARGGQLAFEVPQPEGWDGSKRALWQHALQGTALGPSLYGEDGAAIARRVGHALGSLALSGVRPSRTFDGSAQMNRSFDLASDLIRRVPSLAARIRRLVDGLAALHERIGVTVLRPIHGDPHADQWLDCGNRLGLLDFEAVAFGDPELDAAVFLAELEFEDARVVAMEELEAAYADGAASTGLVLNQDLLRVYRGHKRLAKALRSASGLRPDADRRAETHLELALECVA